jgi:hypothetical protein
LLIADCQFETHAYGSRFFNSAISNQQSAISNQQSAMQASATLAVLREKLELPGEKSV